MGRPHLPVSRLGRQLALLGLVVLAVALAVAFPLRDYLGQRSDEAAAAAEQVALQQQRDDLQAQIVALQDPAHIRAEARRRLQLVTPGDTVYSVHAPGFEAPVVPPATVPAPPQPWYGDLWQAVAPEAAAAARPTSPANEVLPTLDYVPPIEDGAAGDEDRGGAGDPAADGAESTDGTGSGAESSAATTGAVPTPDPVG